MLATPFGCLKGKCVLRGGIEPFGVVVPSFVFQAYDGIRDTSVTGVQTCALPICLLADQVFQESLAVVRPEMTEFELAEWIVKRMKELGAIDESFDTAIFPMGSKEARPAKERLKIGRASGRGGGWAGGVAGG